MKSASTNLELWNDQTQQLQQQNSALNATVAQLNESLAAEQREIRSLRAQLGSASRTASTLRQQSEQAKSEAELSSSQNVPLSAELQNRQQLGDARNDIERINQLRANDERPSPPSEFRLPSSPID